jgi:hypothetical protein
MRLKSLYKSLAQAALDLEFHPLVKGGHRYDETSSSRLRPFSWSRFLQHRLLFRDGKNRFREA